ncbi:MAG: GMC family oxidoreductase [Bacteroidota bacterium]
MSNSTKKYDVVIVGAGFAGNVMALELAKAGKKVLMLEGGDPFKSDNREVFMQNFFLAMAKTPESPYPQNYNSPRPSVLDIQNITPNSPQGQNGINPVKDIATNGYFIEKGPMAFGSTYERVAGGTSWHWLGTCLRLLPSDFKMKTEFGVGVDWPISYDDLSAYYNKAEFEIGVSADVEEQNIHGVTFTPGYKYPMQSLPPTVLDKKFSEKLNGITLDGSIVKVTGTPAGRNSTSNKIDGKIYNNGRRLCQGNTNCTPICPIQAKYDATVTLAKALNTGNVDIMYQTVAYNIQIDESTKKVTGIAYKQYETKLGPVTGEGVVTATSYIIAAHAVETAKLLLMSKNKTMPNGIANSSGQVGKNLMDHPVKLSWGLMPESTYPFRGPLSTSGIETTRDGEFRKKRAAYRIEIGNEGWNWTMGAPYSTLTDLVNKNTFGKALRQEIASNFTRQFRIGFLVEQLPGDGYIVPSAIATDNLGLPRPEVHYDLSDYTKAGFEAAVEATNTIFGLLGAKESIESSNPPASRPGSFTYNNKTYFSNGAGHVMGTHRMGSTPQDSVTDANMKTWDHDNLYLVGCGTFPTTGTANPSLTMMALAYKATEALLKTL